MKGEIVKPEKELSRKRAVFVSEYLVDMNASAAAVRAGYSPAVSKQMANKLMADSRVRNAIDKALSQRSRDNAADANRIIDTLKEMAFDPQCPYAAKLKAIEMLGKYYGMFSEKVQVDTTIRIEMPEAIKELAE